MTPTTTAPDGRRVPMSTLELTLEIWRGAYVCTTCGGVMLRDSREECCPPPQHATENISMQLAAFRWSDDGDSLTALAIFDYSETPRTVTIQDMRCTVDGKPFELTSAEWKWAESQFHATI